MKKMIALLLTLVLTCLFATSAMAVTVKVPGVVCTGATGTKASEAAEPYLTVLVFSTSGGGYFIFWVRNNENDAQVTPAYHIDSLGTKKVYYMSESRTAGYVKAGVNYSARFRTNKDVPTDAESTIHIGFSP